MHLKTNVREHCRLNPNQISVINLLLDEVQNREENLVSVMLDIHCKTKSVRTRIALNVFHCMDMSLTSDGVSVQTVEEVSMWGGLRDVAPHGHENLLQLQGNITTVRSHPSCGPPCESHKHSLTFIAPGSEARFQIDHLFKRNNHFSSNQRVVFL